MKKKALVALLAGSAATLAAALPSVRSVPTESRPAPVHLAGLAQLPAPAARPAHDSGRIAQSVDRWRSLRQSDRLPFSAYASFLVTHSGWPGETAMRRSAENAIDPGSAPAEVASFFARFPPLTNVGHARHAFALQGLGRSGEAREAARRAWTGGALPRPDEDRLLTQFGPTLAPTDHDARIDALLYTGATSDALRIMPLASAQRRPVLEARYALQTKAPDAMSRVQALGAAADGDAGLVIDRAVWMRETGNSVGARQWLAQPRRLTAHPANPARFMEQAVGIARAAANDRQWSNVYGIALLVDGIFPAGTDVSQGSFAERDQYTNLTWLGGTAASQLGRHADAARMFDLYGRAARSGQTRSKGFFWAGRAAARAGQTEQANGWFGQAAESADQFYGLLALERLGRTAAAPPPAPAATPQERAAFEQRPLVQAVRHLGLTGQRTDQGLFVRALAASLDNDRDRGLAADLGRSIGRPDMGVWAAREARTAGDSFFTRQAFPEVPIPPAYRNHWATAHAIMRQESSFERTAVSSANARGMMQLIPGTAQIEARRVGVPYNLGRLTDDANYNILLGTAHLNMLMERFGNNLILVAIAYNAGPGRVPQWIERNGDPRLPDADVLTWLEEIPFGETRNYVQRVVENAVIYDMMNPAGSRSQGRISYYLGRHALR